MAVAEAKGAGGLGVVRAGGERELWVKGLRAALGGALAPAREQQGGQQYSIFTAATGDAGGERGVGGVSSQGAVGWARIIGGPHLCPTWHSHVLPPPSYLHTPSFRCTQVRGSRVRQPCTQPHARTDLGLVGLACTGSENPARLLWS